VQKYILIPEVPCIIRKEADGGGHIAHYVRLSNAERDFRELTVGFLDEHILTWRDYFTHSFAVVKFKEQA